MLEKEKEIWREIIEIFRDMPFLWDKTNSNYLNRDSRHEGYTILLEKYKMFDNTATLAVFKKKLENMRTTYNRELRKMKTSKITGSGLDDIYIPSLWYFDLFGFLEEKTQPCREGRDSLENCSQEMPQEPADLSNEEVVHQETVASNSDTPSVIPVTPNPIRNKRKPSSLYKAKEEVLNKAKKLLDEKEDEWEIIGKSLGLQLGKGEPHQSAIAQKLISDVIFYAKLGKLIEESSIVHSIWTPNSSHNPSLSGSHQSRQSTSTSRLSQYSATYAAPPSVSPRSTSPLAPASTSTPHSIQLEPARSIPFNHYNQYNTDDMNQYLVFH